MPANTPATAATAPTTRPWVAAETVICRRERAEGPQQRRLTRALRDTIENVL